jgi:hypothetical protein
VSTVAADQWKLLLHDFVAELIDDVRTLKAEGKKDEAFELGRRTAYYELLDRLHQQIEAFGLDANEIGFKDADLEREIL